MVIGSAEGRCLHASASKVVRNEGTPVDRRAGRANSASAFNNDSSFLSARSPEGKSVATLPIMATRMARLSVSLLLFSVDSATRSSRFFSPGRSTRVNIFARLR